MSSLTLTAPSSKSLSHRAIIASALAKGTSELSGVLESLDLERTIGVLQNCGAKITRKSPGSYTIVGINGAVHAKEPVDCFVGESGTTCRLLAGVVAAGTGRFHFYGEGRMHERPIQDLTSVLETMGTTIEFLGKKGFPPFIVFAHNLSIPANLPDGVFVNSEESSQYLSGLLLAAPVTPQGLSLCFDGNKAVSKPYVLLTLQTLINHQIPFSFMQKKATSWEPLDWRGDWGGDTNKNQKMLLRIDIAPTTYSPISGRIEGDYSGASYLLASGALGKTPVTVSGLNPLSLQGDAALLSILQQMGAKVVWENDNVTVFPASLRGVTVDMGDCPDLVPTVAVLAARATGTTHISNVAHLRIKESNRIAAPAQELAKIGCMVEELADGMTITPAPKNVQHGHVALSSHDDHRIAMSLSLLELGDDITVEFDNPSCVAKSYPHFWQDWAIIRPQSNAGIKRNE